MKPRTVLLVSLFVFSFITLIFLTASMLGDSWWSTTLADRNDRVGLLRLCTTVFFQKSPELVCSFRENALKFYKNSKADEDFDTAAIINILSLCCCLIAIIILAIAVFYPFIVWVPALALLFSNFSSILTIILVVFVHLKIHSNIDNILGTNFDNKSWTFFIAYCALVSGLISTILGFVFMLFNIVQHFKKGERLNDQCGGIIASAPDVSGHSSSIHHENQSYSFEDLQVYPELDNVDSLKYIAYGGYQEPQTKMRAVYPGSSNNSPNIQFNYN